MPLARSTASGSAARRKSSEGQPAVFPDESWLGRVVNALGEPIDGKGPLPQGPGRLSRSATTRRPPTRAGRVGGKLDLGVRAMNTFLTCCRGQRMGIFAGSGVGKSVLLSMLARYTSAATSIVIGLIGERGREVQEFIEETLGERAWRAASSSSPPPTSRR